MGGREEARWEWKRFGKDRSMRQRKGEKEEDKEGIEVGFRNG